MKEQNRNDQAQRQLPTRSRNWESVSGVMRGGREKGVASKKWGRKDGNEWVVNNEWTNSTIENREFLFNKT